MTYQHIRDGKVGDSFCCPVALAVKEALGEEVRVTQFGVVRRSNGQFICRFPEDIGDRIVEYDLSGKMSPFGFEV